MAETSRSGRVTIPAAGTKTIVLANLVGNDKAIYRIFNGGKNGDTVTVSIVPTGGTVVTHTLIWKDSVDVSVGNQAITVTAGAREAEIVYDLLGIVG